MSSAGGREASNGVVCIRGGWRISGIVLYCRGGNRAGGHHRDGIRGGVRGRVAEEQTHPPLPAATSRCSLELPLGWVCHVPKGSPRDESHNW